jgi:hypothetical protein
MSTLSDQLAGLGLRPASDVDVSTAPERVLSIVGDLQERLERAPHADHELTDEGMDMFVALGYALARLGWSLAKRGAALGEVTHRYRFQRPCEHTQVETDEALAMVRCKACGAAVNATWWIHRHAEEMTRAEERRIHLDDENRRQRAENERLREERSKVKQQVRRGKMTAAKQVLRADGSDYLVPPAPRRTKR